MDNLISSLPQNTTASIYYFVVIDNNKGDEGNVCTKSQVAAVNEEEYQIGARFVEKLVFQNTAWVLDQAEFAYQMLVYCIDGRCEVVIKNMSYIYEADRAGGGKFPAEDLISDDNALNKKKDGFQKGGVKKFRMKTIDRKDEIFANISRALKQTASE